MTFVRCHLMLCYFSKGLNLCVSVLYINEVQVCFGWQYYPWQSLANVTVFSRTWKSSVEDRSVHTIVWIIASNILKRHQIADVVQHTGTQEKPRPPNTLFPDPLSNAAPPAGALSCGWLNPYVPVTNLDHIHPQYIYTYMIQLYLYTYICINLQCH